jgi:hypothetical protein
MKELLKFKNGGTIKIKKSRIGSLTSWCKRNGFNSCTEECKRKASKSSNPAIRKKGQFALNASKWNH